MRRKVAFERIYQTELLVVMYWKKGRESLQMMVVGIKSWHQDPRYYSFRRRRRITTKG